VRSQLKVSERQACQGLGQYRSTQRHVPKGHADEYRLVADIIELARQFGRYGYRRIAALLKEAVWSISDGRIERLWRREGLKVSQKQPKKRRLWLNPSRDIAAQCPAGQWTDHAFSCVLSIAIMSGVMTLFIAGPMMVKYFEH
jgi:transposase InsO family protein